MEITHSTNPFLNLQYEQAMENLGDDYYDVVAAAKFPMHVLRWRNDQLLPQIGLNPTEVEDEHFVEAFGLFQGVRPFLALRYHGYQFGEYNPQLGDGRGFLYGQVRGVDGELYDFGTKGSGRTPYSRTADGCLTLKGGVREVLAAEMLHRLGVKTSRCLSMIETGDKLWRGDEPSPTRSSVMVRFSRSHIRFGTFERLHAIGRADWIEKLLNHAIAVYYPHLGQSATPIKQKELYALFYAELVQRVAALVAQWMAAGFCHAVLNTDNMSITGESFDYGPYAFIPTYDPQFTAAYFDYYGRYRYANQPAVCYWNLEMLQYPLRMVMEQADMEAGLAKFQEHYRATYCEIMLNRLGLEQLSPQEAEEIITLTLQFLSSTQMGYHDFFIALRQQFDRSWREDSTHILSQLDLELSDENKQILENWRSLYYHYLIRMPETEMVAIAARLKQHNPTTILLRPEIESVWERITLEDDWQPFYDLVAGIQA
jgi:serine/tyrosine/threonine adenylyltransferase